MQGVPLPSQVTGRAMDDIYRRESRRVLATLIRLLGDFDLAEDALHEAFRAALEQWPALGIPANPAAWLVSVGRFKAIDGLRRQNRFTAWDEVAEEAEAIPDTTGSVGKHEELEDDRLRLIFTCCHPSLAEEAQVALTLREVCGLTTEEIARSFLLPARLASVLRVVYLVFNEGYSASSGTAVTRSDLGEEAIRLARLLYELLPQAEVCGLLALMLLHQSRRGARSDAHGDLVPLDEQDRSLWSAELIAEGCALTERALSSPRIGAYALQAAISAVHAEAPAASATDWPQIVGLYDVLLQRDASPVVQLNRAVAVAMRDGPAAGLALIDALLAQGELTNYHLAYAAQADMLRRLARFGDARTAYHRALDLAQQEPERRFLAKRLAALV